MTVYDEADGVTEGAAASYVDDGFGSAWEKCGDSRCDLAVVRPGKVQCAGYCEDHSTAGDTGGDKA